jgi:hypothetical protein
VDGSGSDVAVVSTLGSKTDAGADGEESRNVGSSSTPQATARTLETTTHEMARNRDRLPLVEVDIPFGMAVNVTF